jgi:hypothetical protein
MEILHSLYQQRYKTYYIDSIHLPIPSSIFSNSWKRQFLLFLSPNSLNTGLITSSTSSPPHWKVIVKDSSEGCLNRFRASRESWTFRCPLSVINTWSAVNNWAEIQPAPESLNNFGSHLIINIKAMASKAQKSHSAETQAV